MRAAAGFSKMILPSRSIQWIPWPMELKISSCSMADSRTFASLLRKASSTCRRSSISAAIVFAARRSSSSAVTTAAKSASIALCTSVHPRGSVSSTHNVPIMNPSDVCKGAPA